jgi:hypothetical protein
MPQQKDYDNTNRGTLFINKDKKKMANERDTSNWSDMQGKLNIYGFEFYLNGWSNVIKQGDNKGDKFLSLSVKPSDETKEDRIREFFEHLSDGKENNNTSKKGSSVIDDSFDDMDDDLPF